MCCGLLEVFSLDFDVVWVKLGASIGGGDDLISGSRTVSLLVKGGDLTLSDEASGLTRSRSSLNSLAADLVRVYDGLIFFEKKTKSKDD
jgi:hypothetical protein